MLLIDLSFFVLLCICLSVCLFVLLCICFSVCLFVCRCNNQTHTRVLNLRHVESTFSFFLFTYFYSPGLFSQTLPHFCSLLPCTIFAVLFHFRWLSLPPLSLSPSLSLSVSLAALSTWPFSFWATADKQILSFASRIFQLTSSSPSRSRLSLLTSSLRLLHPITQQNDGRGGRYSGERGGFYFCHEFNERFLSASLLLLLFVQNISGLQLTTHRPLPPPSLSRATPSSCSIQLNSESCKYASSPKYALLLLQENALC